ncbi:MAG: hypothetical protein VX737_00230 [Pseudomonadota bacterium]|nr:hypothetical protein [Pseudomonadota bacterium]
MYFFGADSILTDIFEAFINFTKETSKNKGHTYEQANQRKSLLNDLWNLTISGIGMLAILVINELLKKSLIQQSFSIFIESLAQNAALLFILCPPPIKAIIIMTAIFIYREPIGAIFYSVIARFKSYFNETQENTLDHNTPAFIQSDRLQPTKPHETEHKITHPQQYLKIKEEVESIASTISKNVIETLLLNESLPEIPPEENVKDTIAWANRLIQDEQKTPTDKTASTIYEQAKLIDGITDLESRGSLLKATLYTSMLEHPSIKALNRTEDDVYRATYQALLQINKTIRIITSKPPAENTQEETKKTTSPKKQPI